MNSAADQLISECRKNIDGIDAALIYLLAERFKITQKIGQYKAERQIPVTDLEREKTQIARVRALAQSVDLEPEVAEKILSLIVREATLNQERLRNGA